MIEPVARWTTHFWRLCFALAEMDERRGLSRLSCGDNQVTLGLAGWMPGSALALIGAALLVDKDPSTPDNAKS